ncbi:uncharacterized protein LOC109809945 [Cajanus cajan]|uniref:DUF7054 domain-containing protein n=1 Tax=Cajanus cajan TaxID=3821 RepID=A0A151SNN9_CAJCA|nr:uncharacterized protein LOC109809945 [Cajanus cajan]KYP56437.1 hypothetical protein KK1_002676 [Cajanus cajan]
MTSASPAHRRKFSGKEQPEKHSGLLRRFAPAPLTLKLPSQDTDSFLRPSKMLLNVTFDKCVGAVQVVMSPEDTVADLIKTALAFYEKEKRRPLLKNTHPNCYDLHYSSFTLESLKGDDKLLNLGSRNFFLRSKPATSSSCFRKPNTAIDSAFPWMVFVPLML